MPLRILALAAVCAAGLVTAIPASAKTPPRLVVAKVGIEVAKLGLATGQIDSCTSQACLAKGYTAYFEEAQMLDRALEALWTAAGRSGTCASAAAAAAAGFDSLTGDYRKLQRATLAADKAAATKAVARIHTKVSQLSAIVGSFKSTCR